VRPGFVRATVEGEADVGESQHLLATCRRMLRLDDDLSRFYERAAADPDLSWVTAGSGRMLRSPTVFEDVVKTICTTNCSWSGTERMVGALVRHLGRSDASGRHAFPRPESMADADEDFYRQQARAGYRGAYLRALAIQVADAQIDLEALNDPALPDAEAETRLLALPGVGPYAVAHIMLTSLGRYGLLVFDSWTRPTFARLSGRKASDQAIRRRFRKYGNYRGLAFWLYLTQNWLDD
jgi:N-glycosylase/DNA lyase